MPAFQYPVGGGGGGGGGLTMADVLIQKSVLVSLGYLNPGMATIMEATDAFPALDFSNLQFGASLNPLGTRTYLRYGSAGPNNWGWTLGGPKTEVLVLLSSRVFNTNAMVFVAPVLPVTLDLPDKSVTACEQANAPPGYQCYVNNLGVYTDITGASGLGGAFQFDQPRADIREHHVQVALYFNTVSQRRAMLLRKGFEPWYPVIDTSTPNILLPPTVSFWGYRAEAGGIVSPEVDSMWNVCPIAAYAKA